MGGEGAGGVSITRFGVDGLGFGGGVAEAKGALDITEADLDADGDAVDLGSSEEDESVGVGEDSEVSLCNFASRFSRICIAFK